jgi:hypothetical protein
MHLSLPHPQLIDGAISLYYVVLAILYVWGKSYRK